MVEQNLFYVHRMDGHDGTHYYKITDKKSLRYCYATPRMLDEVLQMLVNCIREGRYVYRNNHVYDYKVWCMFLDKCAAEKAYEYVRTKTGKWKLDGKHKHKIEWEVIQQYLAKRYQFG